MNEMEQSNVTTDAVHRTQNRQKDRIQILTTLNGAYLPRLQVLLTSIRASQPEKAADIWLMHSGIPQEDLEPVARNYNTYLLRSGGICDMDWVMGNTAVLHFCGKSKPWQKGYIHRFGILYKHYEQLTRKWT